MDAQLTYARLNFDRLASDLGLSLDDVFAKLQALYDDVDARNARNTKGVPIPCHRGCAMCCYESVFVTPLEFLFAWRHFAAHASPAEHDAVIARGLSLFAEHKTPIEALVHWPKEDSVGRARIARTLRFACPLLDDTGSCRIYPARELLARLFGQSFNAQGGVYGCHLVGQALKNKELTLASSEAQSARLLALPLTSYRQVYPYFIQLFFGADKPPIPS